MRDALPLPTLPPDTTIDVWLINLDHPADPGVNLDGILSLEERNRADRFAFERDARRFRVCRSTLRLGLGRYLQKSPRDIRLTTGAWGKPFLADGSPLHFNVSHSEGLGLIAFTTMGEVGIDVETLDRAAKAAEISSAYFTCRESAMIEAGTTPQERASIFLRLWTRKEAVLKAAGYGIARGLDIVDLSHDPASGASLTGAQGKIDGNCWMVRDLQPIRGSVGAVAAAPGEWSIKQWHVGDEAAIDRVVDRFPGTS